MLYYRIDWSISSKFPPSTVFTKKQEMHGNRMSFMLKLICLTDVIKSRCKSYSSYWKCWLFKKYCGALKVKHHKHFLKRKLIQVFDNTENKWQVKTIILSIREFGELIEYVIKKNKKDNWIWRSCHSVWILSWVFSPNNIPKGLLHLIFTFGAEDQPKIYFWQVHFWNKR